MHPLTGAISIMVQEKIIQKYQRWDHPGSIEKQPPTGIWKRILDSYLFRKNNQVRPPKLFVWQKKKHLMVNQAFTRRDGKLSIKRVMVKAGIPPFINEETVLRVLEKDDLKWAHFRRKKILTKNDLNLRLKFARKVCCKCAMCNYGKWNHQKACSTRVSRS